MPRSVCRGDSGSSRDGAPAFDRSRPVTEVTGRSSFENDADNARESSERRPDGDAAGFGGE